MYKFERIQGTDNFTLIRDNRQYTGYTPETVCKYIVEDIEIAVENTQEGEAYFKEFATHTTTWNTCINLINKAVMEELVERIKKIAGNPAVNSHYRRAGLFLLGNMFVQADHGCIGAAEIGIDLITGWIAVLPAYIGNKDVNYLYSIINAYYHNPEKIVKIRAFWDSPEDTPYWYDRKRQVNAATLPAYYALICKSYGDDDYDDYLNEFIRYATAAQGVSLVFPDTLSCGRETDEHGQLIRLIPLDSVEYTTEESTRQLKEIASGNRYPGIRYQAMNTLIYLAGRDLDVYREVMNKIKFLRKINPDFTRGMFDYDSPGERKRAESHIKDLRDTRALLLKSAALISVISLALFGITTLLQMESVQTFLICAGALGITLFGLAGCDVGFVGTKDGLEPFFIWK